MKISEKVKSIENSHPSHGLFWQIPNPSYLYCYYCFCWPSLKKSCFPAFFYPTVNLQVNMESNFANSDLVSSYQNIIFHNQFFSNGLMSKSEKKIDNREISIDLKRITIKVPKLEFWIMLWGFCIWLQIFDPNCMSHYSPSWPPSPLGLLSQVLTICTTLAVGKANDKRRPSFAWRW